MTDYSYITKPKTGVSYGTIKDTPPPREKDVISPSNKKAMQDIYGGKNIPTTKSGKPVSSSTNVKPRTGTSTTSTTSKHRVGGSKTKTDTSSTTSNNKKTLDTKTTSTKPGSDYPTYPNYQEKIDVQQNIIDTLKPTIINKNVNLRPNERLTVQYEDELGNIRSVNLKASSYSNFVDKNPDKRVVTITRSGGYVIYDIPTSKEYQDAYMGALEVEYIQSGYIPSYIHKEIDIPDSIKDLGNKGKETYIKTSYELGLGLIDVKTAQEWFLMGDPSLKIGGYE